MKPNRFLRKLLAMLLVFASLTSLYGIASATSTDVEDPVADNIENATSVATDSHGVLESTQTVTPGKTDDSYTVTVDAVSKGIHFEANRPMDITIIVDRSASMANPAAKPISISSASWTSSDNIWAGINSMTKLNSALSCLDTTKPDGYYVASNWLNSDLFYGANEIPYAGGYVSFGRMKYNSNRKRWEVLVPEPVPMGSIRLQKTSVLWWVPTTKPHQPQEREPVSARQQYRVILTARC